MARAASAARVAPTSAAPSSRQASSPAPRASAAGRAPTPAGAPYVPLNATRSSLSGEAGAPLALPLRAELEQSLGVDLAAVRLHTGPEAAALAAAAGARAFALGTDVYLGAGERATDLALVGHEVAHVLQQRGAPALQRKRWGGAGAAGGLGAAGGPSGGTAAPDALEHEAERVSAAVVRGRPAVVSGRAEARPQYSFGSWVRRGISAVGGAIARGASAVAGAVGDIVGAALNFVRDHARLIPGYDMLAFILGRDPITQQPVERNAVNLIRALMGLWPGGSLVFDALQRYGIIERVGAWLSEQLATLGLAASAIRQALDRFLATLGPSDILDLGGVWARARRIFSEPIDRATQFVRGLVAGVLRFIREAVLRPLARLAQGTRGYDLLRGILGEDPITGEPYPRTPENMIGGFMRLVGQEEKWRHLQESRAIPRVWAWFQQQFRTLVGFVRQVPQLFVRAWQSLQISDLLNLPGAFARMRDIFGGFVARFVSWAGDAALQIMMFIFEALAPGAMPVLRRAQAVIRTIVAEPIRFVGNLVRAGLRGFEQFRDHIRTHLINGLVGWLTGALTGAGLTLPERWDFRGILSLVLQILGLTWQNIRQKLLRHIPESVLSTLETTFDILITLVRDGPLAAWNRIREHLTNLQEMIFGQVRDWVIRTVVGQAVIRILSMLNPAGAVIQAIIAIYNTIMFFRERLQQIIQVAESFFNSVAQIAAGAIGAAADRVEQTMGRLVPVVISFLARLIGLGGISDTIRNIIARIRAPIDRALDRVVDWLVAQARRAGRAVMSAVRGRDTRTPEEKQRDLERAVRELRPQVEPLLRRGWPMFMVRARLAIWRMQYRLTSLTLDGRRLVATINPSLTLAEGWTFEDTQVFAVIDRIAGEFITEARQEAATRPSSLQQRTVGGVQREVEVVDLTQRAAPGAGAAAISRAQRQEFLIGQTAAGAPLAFGHSPEQRVFGPPWWWGIGSGGVSGPRGQRYDDLARSLHGLPVGDWLTALVRRQPLPAAATPHRAAVEEMFGLLMALEPSHGQGAQRRDLVYSLMGTQLMSGPAGRPVEQVVGSGGVHPSAFGGAQTGARLVTAEMRGAAGGGTLTGEERALADERRRRERDLLVAWFTAHRDKLPLLDHAPTLQDVENWVRDMIRQYVRGT